MFETDGFPGLLIPTTKAQLSVIEVSPAETCLIKEKITWLLN